MHTVLRTHRFNQKFLYAGGSQVHTVYHERIETAPLDEMDVALLRRLASRARDPLVELAKAIKVHPNVVKYHLKKLQRTGIIMGYVSAASAEKLGLEFYQINFILKNLERIPEIIEFFDATNRCLFALELLGRYDLTIELHLENDRALRQILEAFKERFVEDYHDYDVFTIFKEHHIVWLPV